MDCIVCGTAEDDKAMVFKNTGHCSENHRKVIAGERPPTEYERAAMDKLAAAGNEATQALIDSMGNRW